MFDNYDPYSFDPSAWGSSSVMLDPTYLDLSYYPTLDSTVNNPLTFNPDFWPSADLSSLSTGTSWYDPIIRGLGSVGNWLSKGDNLKGLISTGLGALGMYGNYQANRATADNQKAMAKVAKGQLDLANRQAKAQQAAELAGRASIANILANRGRLAAGQSNPWLNYLYQAQKEGSFTPQGGNPFQGYEVGSPIGPLSNDQLLAGLDALNANAPRVGYAGGGAVRSLGKYLEGVMTPIRKEARGLPEITPQWIEHNREEMAQEYLQSMKELSERLGKPFNPEEEMASFNTYLTQEYGDPRGLIKGEGGGQDDTINARVSAKEYIFDADTVSALGDGNPEEGAKKLDQMRERIRAHKRSAPTHKIPPMAKDPMEYLAGDK